MTKAACNLILNITKICLSWRSIKSLKRLGKSQSEGNNNDISSNNNMNMNMVDLEILQLWSLIATLTIYEQSGLERIICLFPLYYYLKMILIIITAIPSTKFPDFWCELILVPMMKQIHELMDLDWRSVLEEEVVLLPWRVVDLILLPGVFCDDLVLEEVKMRRLMQIEKAIEDGRNNVGGGGGGFGRGHRDYDEDDDGDHVFDGDGNGDDEAEEIHEEGMDGIDSSNAADRDNAEPECDDDNDINNIDIDMDINIDNENENDDHGDENLTIETIIDLNTNNDEHESSKPLIQTPSLKEGSDPSSSKSPSPRSSKSTSALKSTSSSTSTLKSKSQSKSRSTLGKGQPPPNRKATNRRQTSFSSPVARSRVAASSLHLRKFSRDHKPSSGLLRETKAMAMRNNNNTNNNSNKKKKIKDGLTSSSPTKQKMGRNNKGAATSSRSTRGTASASARSRTNKAPPLSAFQRTKVSPTKGRSPKSTKSTNGPNDNGNDNDCDNDSEIDTLHKLIDENETDRDDNGNSDDGDNDSYGDDLRGRESLGNRLRNFITGDTNIRIRDYLFDLDLPAVPSRDSTMGISKTFDNDHDHDHDHEPDVVDQEDSSILEEREYEQTHSRPHSHSHDLRRRAATKQTNRKKGSSSTASVTTSSNVTLRRSQRIAGKK